MFRSPRNIKMFIFIERSIIDFDWRFFNFQFKICIKVTKTFLTIHGLKMELHIPLNNVQSLNVKA